MDEPSAIYEIIHSIIQEPSEERLSVLEMCQIAGVSRSGYYAWVKAAPKREAQEEQDRKDFDLILKAYKHRVTIQPGYPPDMVDLKSFSSIC